jgi:hypothetical protein
MSWFFGLLLLWIGMSAVVVWIANIKGRSGVLFLLLALVTSPLVAVVVVLMVAEKKQCAHCLERILAGATICRYCQKSQIEAPRTAA